MRKLNIGLLVLLFIVGLFLAPAPTVHAVDPVKTLTITFTNGATHDFYFPDLDGARNALAAITTASVAGEKFVKFDFNTGYHGLAVVQLSEIQYARVDG